MHANYLFNILNAAAQKGLNLIFLYGHNHSNGWDDYLGGAAVYLEKGDSILIAQNSRTDFKEEILHFTYMNPGYIGYYNRVNESDDTLSMSYFEIKEDRVVIKRYSKDGQYFLKSMGERNEYRNETGYEPDMTVCYSDRPVYLTEVTDKTPIDQKIIEETNKGIRQYRLVNSVDELVDGGKYLLISNYGTTDHIMTKMVVSKPNANQSYRTGFDVEASQVFTDNAVSGNYGDMEWSFTKSGSGWLIGDGIKYIKFTDTSDRGITATLEDSGEVFTINATSEGFEFVSNGIVLDYNEFRNLVNGYSKEKTEKNMFYIYAYVEPNVQSEMAAAEVTNEPADSCMEQPETAFAVSKNLTNLALRKNVVVSAETSLTDADYSKENAVDGSTSTRWCSQDVKDGQGSMAVDIDDAWIYVDLGILSEVQSIKVSFFNLKYPVSWKVQASNTAADDSWVDIAAPEGCTTSHPVVTIDLDEVVKAKYIRLYFETMNPSAAGHGIDVKEIEVYGVAGTPCDTCEEKMVVRKIEGSCTEDGYTGDEVCTVCYRTVVQGEEIIAPGHGWNWKEDVLPSCTTRGEMTKECAACEENRKGDIKELKHDFSTWKVVVPAGKEDGLKERTCLVCDEKEERKIDKIVNPFGDVVQGQYYYEPVLWAVERKITSGLNAGGFGVGQSCTREQIVTFLWNYAGKPAASQTTCTFKDVNANHYYYKAMLWANENGYVSGYNADKFGVGDPCTREQIVMILWKYAKTPSVAKDACTFTDVNKAHYYYNAMLWAVEHKIVSGYNESTFGVGDACTREQIVTFLYRYDNK